MGGVARKKGWVPELPLRTGVGKLKNRELKKVDHPIREGEGKMQGIKTTGEEEGCEAGEKRLTCRVSRKNEVGKGSGGGPGRK